MRRAGVLGGLVLRWERGLALREDKDGPTFSCRCVWNMCTLV